MTIEEFGSLIERMIQKARDDGVPDEELATKLRDAADALREG
jgi:hypothetical protein